MGIETQPTQSLVYSWIFWQDTSSLRDMAVGMRWDEMMGYQIDCENAIFR